MTRRVAPTAAETAARLAVLDAEEMLRAAKRERARATDKAAATPAVLAAEAAERAARAALIAALPDF